ncbi:Phosphatidylserine decarboxylase proenzyme 1, mitochondrial [Porphyridium purpureum]|uniref:phosphatidylserine decarboxylase n=1 Tax=Porphyridium purpureum TaxID=35688 RepID=A0A5J4Z1F8_PORPP|nr:Phosphatidylserine decarboxylase proenzyme 1, mitochondrial [Porphyridium purpureum]|eukprot:POR0325..scf208_2
MRFRRIASGAAVLSVLGVAGGAYTLKAAFPPLEDGCDFEALSGEPLSVGMYDFVTRQLPLRAVSRLWGTVNELPLPVPLRAPLYNSWCRTFDCDVDQAEKPLKEYANLQEFFGRALKPGLRPTDTAPDAVVSPCDGRVLTCGPVGAFGKLHQVKGFTYDLRDFLGVEGPHEKLALSAVNVYDESDKNRKDAALSKQRSSNQLFQMVLYLAPGDYHNFHSPVDDWQLTKVRHVVGELLSVNPAVARRIPNLFVLNERIVLLGEWGEERRRFFSMTAVGATNVGSIRMFFPTKFPIKTNRVGAKRHKIHEEKFLGKDATIRFDRGDLVGGFRLGSSIVLVFEAPEDFHFLVRPGDRVLCGQKVGQFHH